MEDSYVLEETSFGWECFAKSFAIKASDSKAIEVRLVRLYRMNLKQKLILSEVALASPSYVER
jgi:hypothetical protein